MDGTGWADALGFFTNCKYCANTIAGPPRSTNCKLALDATATSALALAVSDATDLTTILATLHNAFSITTLKYLVHPRTIQVQSNLD